MRGENHAAPKYQQVAVDEKYQHEVQVSSRGPGVVYVRINNNRILFDSILEELNPHVVEKLDSLWDSDEPIFHLNRNGQAALPDCYPWLSIDTAPKAMADIRLAVQESTASLPEPVKTAFLEKLAQDLTAPPRGPSIPSGTPTRPTTPSTPSPTPAASPSPKHSAKTPSTSRPASNTSSNNSTPPPTGTGPTPSWPSGRPTPSGKSTTTHPTPSTGPPQPSGTTPRGRSPTQCSPTSPAPSQNPWMSSHPLSPA